MMNILRAAGAMKVCAAIALTGAALTVAAPANAAELVSNGGFETGDFSSWTQFDNTTFTGVAGPVSGTAPHSGAFQAFFGAVGSTGGITQTLNTVAGTTYSISVWAANLSDGTPNFGSISFDGNVLGSLTNAPDFGYTNYTFSAVASSAQTALTFTFRHDPSYYLLDDVSVSGLAGGVPEPTTWAFMILGFGGVGVALRRRNAVQAKLAFARA